MVTFITQRLNFVTSVFTSKEITLYQNVQVQLANNQFKISILLLVFSTATFKKITYPDENYF